jgi:hypothetical protein
MYKYVPLAYQTALNSADFTCVYPLLHTTGIKFNRISGHIMINLLLQNVDDQQIINKYNACYMACKKSIPTVVSPLILNNDKTGYYLCIKLNKNSIFTDKNSNLIKIEELYDKELWIEPTIQWERIPLSITSNLQLKLISAKVINWKFVKEKKIERVYINQPDQTYINNLQCQLNILLKKCIMVSYSVK